MAVEIPFSTPQQILASMFFGTTIAFILHGITWGQMVWFLRKQSARSSTSMIYFVIFVWLVDSLNCALMFLATLDMFFSPSVTVTSSCSDWVARSQSIPETLCTLSVEGFFIMRVWKLTEHKKLSLLMLIPYLASYAFAFAQVIRSLQVRCDPNVPDINPLLIYGANGFKFVLDCVVSGAMCYMLYKRSSGFTRNANTIKIVRGLILWSISTGLLMLIIDLLFLLSIVGFINDGYFIYYITGGIYVNAMFAQLNARARFRAMAEASIPLSSISLGESSSSEPVNREL